MESLYNLKYEILNLKNLDIAFKIQKEIWPDDHDYEDLYDKPYFLFFKVSKQGTKVLN